MNKAVVVFLGQKSVDDPAWYARWLKTGFVHCFVLVESEGLWIKIEATRGRVQLTILDDVTASHYRDQGAVAVETAVQLHGGFPFAIKSCVGFTKAVMGLKSWAVTPFGLYKYLERVT